MMAGSSLRRVTMDDYDTEVRPGNQLDKASHVERGPIYGLAHIHILVFEPLVYHLLFFNYFVCQLLRIPTTV